MLARKKINKNSKLLILALVVMMVLSLCSCAKEQTAGETGTNTLTYWVPLPSSIATRASSFNDVLMYQQREADTGIHIEFIHPAQGQATEQFNLMVASRDLPDLIEYDWREYQGGPQQAMDDGIIIPINEYMDKYAPNFKKIVTDKNELSPVYDKGSKTDSGNYFGFPNFNTGTARIFGGPMIRKDWLDELDLEVPETIDEWTEVLRAFKEKKGANAPLSATADYFKTANAINGAYGVGHRLYLDGNKVKFGPLEENFKAYLAQLNLWYKEGLLDRDFSTNKRNIVDSKMTKGNSGVTFNTLGAGMGVYLNQMQKEDPNYNLIGIPYPVLNKGDVNKFAASEGDVHGSILAVTTACKDPQTAISWADYFYSDEGYMLLNFGVEGNTYNSVDGKPVYTDKIMKNSEGMSVSEALSMDCRATASAPGLRQAPEYLEQYYAFPQQIESYQLWAKNVDGVREVTLPGGLTPSHDEYEEFAALSNDINTYVEEMCLKYITGEESLDNYDNFVKMLKNTFKVERYIELQQAMYDRYLKR